MLCVLCANSASHFRQEPQGLGTLEHTITQWCLQVPHFPKCRLCMSLPQSHLVKQQLILLSPSSLICPHPCYAMETFNRLKKRWGWEERTNYQVKKAFDFSSHWADRTFCFSNVSTSTAEGKFPLPFQITQMYAALTEERFHLLPTPWCFQLQPHSLERCWSLSLWKARRGRGIF